MPELIWNKTDFLDCFSAEPTVEEDSCSFSYEIERNGLRLDFTVWECEGVIQTSLFRAGSDRPLHAWAAFVRGEARLVKDQRGRYLVFEDCVIAPDRFWNIPCDDVFDRGRFPHSVTVTVAVDPDIQIRFILFESRT